MSALPTERDVLIESLNRQRTGILDCWNGLSDEELIATPTISSLSLLSIVRHLAFVERQWFRHFMADESVYIPWHHGVDEFVIPSIEDATTIRNMYRRECSLSDAITGQHDLNELAARSESEEKGRSLRLILTHMVRETGRHRGQAELIRLALDRESRSRFEIPCTERLTKQ